MRHGGNGAGAGGASRALSAAELLLGAGVVIAHNVFQAIPNEVPILVVLGLLSARLRDRDWLAFGLLRPKSWLLVLLIAVVAAATRIFVGDAVIEPFTTQYWPPAELPEIAKGITGNPLEALKLFAIVWVFAAFGEEFAYRGLLLNRAAGALGKSALAYLAATVIVAILFGYGHYYKGPAGIIDSGFAGLVLGLAYLAAGRNLWAPILAHGFIDSAGVAVLYLGLDS